MQCSWFSQISEHPLPLEGTLLALVLLTQHTQMQTLNLPPSPKTHPFAKNTENPLFGIQGPQGPNTAALFT